MRAIGVATVILVATFCAGCARTSIDSKTLGEASSRIDRIALIFHSAQQFSLKSSYGTYGKDLGITGINKAYENQSLVTRAVRRQFPPVFQKHGIDMEVYLDPSDKGRYEQDADKQRHVMHLKPVAARYSLGAYENGTTLYMEAQLIELRPTRLLWQGNISVFRSQLATIDDDWATAFAEKILAELNEGKIIGTPGAGKPIVPAATGVSQPVVAQAGAAQPSVPAADSPRTAALPAEPGRPRLEDVHAVPFIGESGKDGYEKFLATKRRPRAFVISDKGGWSYRTGPNATQSALSSCEARYTNCYLYAVDNEVLWTPPADKAQ